MIMDIECAKLVAEKIKAEESMQVAEATEWRDWLDLFAVFCELVLAQEARSNSLERCSRANLWLGEAEAICQERADQLKAPTRRAAKRENIALRRLKKSGENHKRPEVDRYSQQVNFYSAKQRTLEAEKDLLASDVTAAEEELSNAIAAVSSADQACDEYMEAWAAVKYRHTQSHAALEQSIIDYEVAVGALDDYGKQAEVESGQLAAAD